MAGEGGCHRVSGNRAPVLHLTVLGRVRQRRKRAEPVDPMISMWLTLIGTLWPPLCLGAENLEDRVVEARLENGLHVLMLERRYAPLVSICMVFKVGSVDDPEGATGTAHLLEHMLFRGTKSIGTRDYEKEKPLVDEIERTATALDSERSLREPREPGRVGELEKRLVELQAKHQKLVLDEELSALYEKQGAVGLNAHTDVDFTTYTVSLPANKLELWMRMESDRLRNPVLRGFYRERKVVLEERRTGVDDNAEGSLYERFLGAAFAAHPYRNPVIGRESHIRRLNVRDVERFRLTHYAPNNVVVALVGDLDPQKVLAQFERYFGDLPAQPVPTKEPAREPKQQAERRIVVHFDAEPRLLLGYHKPRSPHPDDYVFDVIQELLSQGRYSLLQQVLVDEYEFALHASATTSVPGDRYDSLFVIGASPRSSRTLRELKDAILHIVKRLRQEPLPALALKSFKDHMESTWVWELDSNMGLASYLSYFGALGNWRYFLDHPRKVRKVRPKDIQRVAAKYFVPENRTVAWLQRPEKAEGGDR